VNISYGKSESRRKKKPKLLLGTTLRIDYVYEIVSFLHHLLDFLDLQIIADGLGQILYGIFGGGVPWTLQCHSQTMSLKAVLNNLN